MADQKKGKEKPPVRVTAVVTEEDRERIKYWAEKRGMSINEYVRYALDLAIRREAGDYDLPTLESARLNQLVDGMSALSFNVANLESIVINSFESMLRMTRGANYLAGDDMPD